MAKPQERGDNRWVVVGVPGHWPDRHNANMEPCDMIDGACGAWHSSDEEWVRNGIARFGLQETENRKPPVS